MYRLSVTNKQFWETVLQFASREFTSNGVATVMEEGLPWEKLVSLLLQ